MLHFCLCRQHHHQQQQQQKIMGTVYIIIFIILISPHRNCLNIQNIQNDHHSNDILTHSPSSRFRLVFSDVLRLLMILLS